MDLSKAQTSSLIDLYRAHKVLWDHSLPSYKDQHERNRALLKIQAAFNEECDILLEINDIKTKIQSFRSSVSREMKKRKQFLSSGAGMEEDYMPSYTHWKQLQFLTSVIKKRDTSWKSNLEQCSQPMPPGYERAETPEDDKFLVWLSVQPSPLNDDSQITGQSSAPSSPSSPPPPPQLQQQPAELGAHVPTPQTRPTPLQSSCKQSQPSSVLYQHTPAHAPAPQTLPTPLQSSCQQSQPSSALYWHTPAQQPQPTVASSTPPSASNGNKRKELCEEAAFDAVWRYFQNKNARIQSSAATINTGSQDSDSIWAKNLVQDLKDVKCENKRKILKIKISRLVHDEILKQIAQESGEQKSSEDLDT